MAQVSAKTALITGIAGQDGYYLAELLIARSYNVVGTSHREIGGTSIRIAGMEVPIVHLSFTRTENIKTLLETIRPDEVYNLASRSSSAQLFDDPIATSEINGVAVVGFLEVLRGTLPHARFCQASSSELFANSQQSPQDENTQMLPRNAYGAAKLFAHNMVGAYRDQFGVFACSAILFNHESPRRGIEYVTRKVTSSAARIAVGQADSLKIGSLDSRRDWGFAGDYVRAMWLMLQQDAPEDFVIATGQTHSVGDLCEVAFARVGLDYRDHVIVDQDNARKAETIELRGNPAKAMAKLGWRPRVSFAELIGVMVDADRAALGRDPAVS
jgi:GDPmannose 4,6-dehydratase